MRFFYSLEFGKLTIQMNIRKLLSEVYNYQILLTIKKVKITKLHSLTNDEKLKLEAFLTERYNNVSDLKKIVDYLVNRKWVLDAANDFLRLWDFNFGNDEFAATLFNKESQSVLIKKECGVFTISIKENRFSDAPYLVCIESNDLSFVLNECQTKLKPKKQPKTKEKSVMFI